jgi:hypothetical protein
MRRKKCRQKLQPAASDRGTPEFQSKHTLERIKADHGGYVLRVRDKRPIDKYHRLYCIDRDRGVGERQCRGITEDQYRAADRLACNYERTFRHASKPLDGVRIDTRVNTAMYPVESMAHAARQHSNAMKVLSRGSWEIVEQMCCREQSLSEYEEHKDWRKGYGMIRLREALDELVESFRSLGHRHHDGEADS